MLPSEVSQDVCLTATFPQAPPLSGWGLRFQALHVARVSLQCAPIIELIVDDRQRRVLLRNLS